VCACVRISKRRNLRVTHVAFDYTAPAEVFLAKPAKLCCNKYRRFATAAEALRFALEDLRTPKASVRG
jgi:hypothetical protein